MKKNQIQAFSLIELLSVIAILSLLIGLSYPAYQSHLIKARRTDGQTALLFLAGRLEKYALENNSYQEVSFDKLQTKSVSPEGYYQLALVKIDKDAFLITAMPLKSQTADKICGTLALDSLGEKGILRNNILMPKKECW